MSGFKHAHTHHVEGLGFAQQAVELADNKPSERPAAKVLLKKAAASFQEAADLMSHNPQHWFQLGGVHELLDLGASPPKAVQAYSRVVDLMVKTTLKNSLTASQRQLLARTFFKRGMVSVTDTTVPLASVWSDLRQATLLAISGARAPADVKADTKVPSWQEILGHELPAGATGDEAAMALVALMSKAEHMAAQIAYLPPSDGGWAALLPALRMVHEAASKVLRVSGSSSGDAPASLTEALWRTLDRRGKPPARAAVSAMWDKMYHHPALQAPPPAISNQPGLGGACGGSPCLSSTIDWRAVEATYERDRVVVVDNLLSSAGLTSLRLLAHNATVWHDGKIGYVGARLNTGLVSLQLLGVARELSAALPSVVCGRRLKSAWAFKFAQGGGGDGGDGGDDGGDGGDGGAADGGGGAAAAGAAGERDNLNGVGLHADAAAVNLNLWVSEEGANEAQGGMVVHTVEPPAEWTFSDFQNVEKIQPLLDGGGGGRRIEHKPNRLVLFKSNLFHETDRGAFRAGYQNRRINFAFLFGQRGLACPSEERDEPRESKWRDEL